MNSKITNTILIFAIIVVIYFGMKMMNHSKPKEENKNLLQFFKNNDNSNKKLDLEQALKIISQYYNGVRDIKSKNSEYNYNRFTINNQLKKEVKTLLEPILCKLNDIMDKHYKIDDFNSLVKKNR